MRAQERKREGIFLLREYVSRLSFTKNLVMPHGTLFPLPASRPSWKEQFDLSHWGSGLLLTATPDS